jgi:hypothetical protein
MQGQANGCSWVSTICLDIMRVLQDGLGDPKYRPCPLLIKVEDARWLGEEEQH